MFFSKTHRYETFSVKSIFSSICPQMIKNEEKWEKSKGYTQRFLSKLKVFHETCVYIRDHSYSNRQFLLKLSLLFHKLGLLPHHVWLTQCLLLHNKREFSPLHRPQADIYWKPTSLFFCYLQCFFGCLQNKVGRFNVIDWGNVRYAHHFFVFDLARSKFFSRYSQYFFGYLANIFSTHFTRSTPLGTPEGTPPRSVPLVPFVSKSLLRQPKKIARNEKTLTVARIKKKRWSHLYNASNKF